MKNICIIIVGISMGIANADQSQQGVTSVSCRSSEGNVYKLEMSVSSASDSMSSIGTFDALLITHRELSGVLFEQPSINGAMVYQGRSEPGSATSLVTEVNIVVDGVQSQFFTRDLTVMGPTSWREQVMSCSEVIGRKSGI